MDSGLGDHLPLHEHLAVLLNFVESKAPILLTLSADCAFDIFCSCDGNTEQGGLALSGDMLHRFELDLSIDFLIDFSTDQG